MSQTIRCLALSFVVLASLSCGPRRPDFSVDGARDQLASAFEVGSGDVSILSEEKVSSAEAEFRVDFKVPTFRQTLQAKFAGRDAAWHLDGVRVRPRGNQDEPWREVGEMLGEVRAAASEKAEATMELMGELGRAIEALAVDSSNQFPTTDIQGLSRLLTRGRYLETWKHSEDAWGNAFHYYASETGDAYILISRGADNRFDNPVDVYNAKTNAGDFTYEGPTSDASLDLIYATGSFVQSYLPGE